jgi:DNA-binding IclR family transcriptional regulator
LAGPRLLTSTLKCFSLLDVIAEQPGPARLSDLARMQNIGRATVHQQLSTLVHAGWVEQVDDGRYRLTLRATRIGHRALEQVNLGRRIQSALETVAADTGEAVSLAVLDQSEALIVQRVESGQVLRLDLGVGTRMPLATSASGRVLLAFLPAGRAEQLRDSGVELPPEETLRRIRDNGYAVSVSEYLEGIFAVAAPIFDATGILLAVLSAAGPSSRFDPHAAVEPITRAAEEINRVLGGHAPRKATVSTSIQGASREAQTLERVH